VVKALLNALKDPNSDVKRSAASALVGLGANLPKDQAPAVVEALLNALKDPDSSVKRSAASALRGLVADLPKDQAPAVVETLRNTLKDPNSDVKSSAADALGVVGSRAAPEAGPSVFSDLDPLLSTLARRDAEAVEGAIRTLASSKWTQSDDELLGELQSDDSRWRYFALHVLARRHLQPGTLEQIRGLRDDKQGRPWVKLAALRCLVEIEREKRAQEAKAKKERQADAGS
jgi:hypothetical protein